MKQILVPIDFSEESANALHYAMEFNRHFFAKLIFLHVFDIPVTAIDEEQRFIVNYNQLRQQQQERMWDFINTEKQGVFKYDMEVYASSGGHYTVIADFAASRGIDLVILGNKGVGGIRRWLFGSVAKYMLAHAAVPVLCVPAGVAFTKAGKLLLTTDLSAGLSQKNTAFLKTLAERLGASIDILQVVKGKTFKDEKAEWIFSKLQLDFNKTPEVIHITVADDAAATINDFAGANNIDIIVTVPHDHNWLNRFFAGSKTEKLSVLSGKPLMTLPEKAK
jgi:nucleotide-binding universal stress UspA family protein